MKLIKLLTVPAVVLFSLLMAVPAFAHEAAISNLKATCNSDRVVCFDFDVVTSNFDATGRDVILHLMGEQNGKPVELSTKTVHLASNTTHVHDCFPTRVPTDVTGGLTVTITVPEGSDLDLGDSQTSADVAACVTTPTPTPTPTGTPTPTPTTPSTSTPTPTPTTNTTAVLASTGGFDFRFPLIGLAVIVAGLALYLVSASRTRRSTGQK